MCCDFMLLDWRPATLAPFRCRQLVLCMGWASGGRWSFFRTGRSSEALMMCFSSSDGVEELQEKSENMRTLCSKKRCVIHINFVISNGPLAEFSIWPAPFFPCHFRLLEALATPLHRLAACVHVSCVCKESCKLAESGCFSRGLSAAAVAHGASNWLRQLLYGDSTMSTAKASYMTVCDDVPI